MFNTNYFSLLTNKLRNCFIQRPQDQRRFTYAERYERDSMACILERIKTNDPENAMLSELLNWALARKVKTLIEKLLRKEPCCWLDQLNSNHSRLQEPLASMLAPWKIHKISEIANLRKITRDQRIDLLNRLNAKLYKHEYSWTVEPLKPSVIRIKATNSKTSNFNPQ